MVTAISHSAARAHMFDVDSIDDVDLFTTRTLSDSVPYISPAMGTAKASGSAIHLLHNDPGVFHGTGLATRRSASAHFSSLTPWAMWAMTSDCGCYRLRADCSGWATCSKSRRESADCRLSVRSQGVQRRPRSSQTPPYQTVASPGWGGLVCLVADRVARSDQEAAALLVASSGAVTVGAATARVARSRRAAPCPQGTVGARPTSATVARFLRCSGNASLRGSRLGREAGQPSRAGCLDAGRGLPRHHQTCRPEWHRTETTPPSLASGSQESAAASA